MACRGPETAKRQGHLLRRLAPDLMLLQEVNACSSVALADAAGADRIVGSIDLGAGSRPPAGTAARGRHRRPRAGSVSFVAPSCTGPDAGRYAKRRTVLRFYPGQPPLGMAASPEPPAALQVVGHRAEHVDDRSRTTNCRLASSSARGVNIGRDHVRRRKSSTRSVTSCFGNIPARARARVSGSLAKNRSYSTCRPPKELHAISHARWNNRTRSLAELASVARYFRSMVPVVRQNPPR